MTSSEWQVKSTSKQRLSHEKKCSFTASDSDYVTDKTLHVSIQIQLNALNSLSISISLYLSLYKNWMICDLFDLNRSHFFWWVASLLILCKILGMKRLLAKKKPNNWVILHKEYPCNGFWGRFLPWMKDTFQDIFKKNSTEKLQVSLRRVSTPHGAGQTCSVLENVCCVM